MLGAGLAWPGHNLTLTHTGVCESSPLVVYPSLTYLSVGGANVTLGDHSPCDNVLPGNIVGSRGPSWAINEFELVFVFVLQVMVDCRRRSEVCL